MLARLLLLHVSGFCSTHATPPVPPRSARLASAPSGLRSRLEGARAPIPVLKINRGGLETAFGANFSQLPLPPTPPSTPRHSLAGRWGKCWVWMTGGGDLDSVEGGWRGSVVRHCKRFLSSCCKVVPPGGELPLSWMLAQSLLQACQEVCHPLLRPSRCRFTPELFVRAALPPPGD